MRFNLIADYSGQLWDAFLLTIWLSVLVLIITTPVAVLSALVRYYRIPVLGFISGLYVNLFRAIPPLILVYFVYYGLPAFGIRLNPVLAAVIGLCLPTGAYMSQDIKGGLAAVPKGQFEAAHSLAMSPFHIVRRILLPQAFPIVIPAYITTAIQAVKATALAGLVGVNEITGTTMGAMSTTFAATEFLAVAAAVYLLLGGVLALLQTFVESRLKRRTITAPQDVKQASNF